MKTILHVVWGSVLLAGGFWLGSYHGHHQVVVPSGPGGHRILYYVDPMNPAHTSDQPGLAPCGMKLEPVYADQAAPFTRTDNVAPMAPGTVRISPEKQQLIGVQVGIAERKPFQHTVRLLGRVVMDETRLYRINATVDGWITRALPYATGSLVQRQEVLAAFYSPEFLSAGQALLFALGSMDRVTATGQETAAQSNQISQFHLNLKQYSDSLKNLGMGERQIQEMIHSRKFMENVDITAPADGVITARNVSEGQRFDKGTELYRIADLSRVWILADVSEDEANFIQPTIRARVSVPKMARTFSATVSQALPQFDSSSRTLKVRLEAANPDFALKPDMFVDVELPIALPEAVVVAADAVLDSGGRKTVFVVRAEGRFEPVPVETGRRLGDQVEITRGLAAGERIVTAGNFLVDSESRLKLAAGRVLGASVKDLICGMWVDQSQARAANRFCEYQGQTYCFCSDACKRAFTEDPAKPLKESVRPDSGTEPARSRHRATDP